jgi:hypothetical protein
MRLSVTNGTQLFSRQQLEKHMNDLGIWTAKDIRQFLQLQLELRELELQLKKGGIKVTEAKAIALKMRTKRSLLLELYNRRSQFDSITMESMADNKKFKFLVKECVMTEEGVPFFASIDDYENRQEEISAIDSATEMAAYLHGYDKDSETNLVENQWLREFDFADGDGNLINEEGHLVDIDGRLVNTDGRFVDKDGNFIDSLGRRIDDNGDFVVEKTKPFIDDRKKPSVKKTSKKKGTKSTKKK